MKKNLPSISLEFREGTSDKVYKVAIEEVSDKHVIKYVVDFAFGRRNSTLNTGSKTSQPVSLEEAQKIYDKLVLSKTSKGYKIVGEAEGLGTSVANKVVDKDQRDTGLRPQLLNAITEEEAETYLIDNDWCAQEKFDGKRMTIKKTDKVVIAANKKGLSIGFPDAISEGISSLVDATGALTMDGEAVGDVFNAFDLLDANDADLRDFSYSIRFNTLSTFVRDGSKSVVVAKTAIGTKEKHKLMAELKASGKEGIVFKKLSAKWYAGRPASGGSAVKCKFWKSCSCVVLKVNAKRSIEVSLEDQSIGNVTIPPNKSIPTVGQVVEIKYLYVAGKGGSLYQPIYLNIRDDVDIEECTFKAQKLKYKSNDQD